MTICQYSEKLKKKNWGSVTQQCKLGFPAESDISKFPLNFPLGQPSAEKPVGLISLPKLVQKSASEHTRRNTSP